jgi:hypothetical protein
MRYIGAFAIHNHHSLLRHIADVNKQVAVPPGLIGTLDGQARRPVERRPGASIHDKPGTTGNVLTEGKEKQQLAFPCSAHSSSKAKKRASPKQATRRQGRDGGGKKERKKGTHQLEVAVLPFLARPVICVLPRRQKLWPLTVATQGWLPRLAK